MTRSMLSETDFGRSGQFQVLWTSMEELLVSYNEKPYVSESYRGALDGVGGRAERMAAADLPPELPAWMETLGQDSVRALSVTLLIDLLTLERDATRAAGHRGGHGSARRGSADVRRVRRCAGRSRLRWPHAAGRRRRFGRDACRQALDRLAESLAMLDTAALLGDVGPPARATIRAIVEDIGPAAIEALKPVMMVEDRLRCLAPRRRCDRRPSAAPRSSACRRSLGDPRWFVQHQRRAARSAGSARAEGVPLLQPLLRKADPRVAQAAISRLAAIPDPAAARAIHTVLRAATGEMRRAVIEALVAAARSSCRPDARRGSSRRASRSARITRSCSRRSRRLAWCRAMRRSRRWPASSPGAGFSGGGSCGPSRSGASTPWPGSAVAAAQTVLANAAKTGDRLLRKIAAARR